VGIAELLTAEGLLTQQIEQISGDCVTVQVLTEHFGLLDAEQMETLGTHQPQCLVREVLLMTASKPWVYAQSLIPQTLLAIHPTLGMLKNRALGVVLAQTSGISRGALEYAELMPHSPLATRAAASTQLPVRRFWARRSWFAIHDQRLLVQEVFIPNG
jgi:chorismate--pyruvate lyase